MPYEAYQTTIKYQPDGISPIYVVIPQDNVATFDVKSVQRKTVSESLGGYVEQVSHANVYEGTIGFDFLDEITAGKLQAFYSWARFGGQFEIALNADDAVNTTLVNDALRGYSSVDVDSSNGIVYNRTYRLHESTTGHHQIIVVTYVEGNTLNIEPVTLWDYTAGSTMVTSRFYYSPCILDVKSFAITPPEGRNRPWWDISFGFWYLIDQITWSSA